MESQLPAELVALLDLDTLQQEPETFVDAQLRDSYSDVLFRVRLKNPIGATEYVFIYILLEHKSSVDRLTAFQLLRYMVRIWEKCLREEIPLCPVFPFVIYHGESKWTGPTSIQELVPVPDSMKEYSVQCQFPLLDLSQTPKDKLPGNPFLRNLLYLLKYGRSPNLKDVLVELLVKPIEELQSMLNRLQVHLQSLNKLPNRP